MGRSTGPTGTDGTYLILLNSHHSNSPTTNTVFGPGGRTGSPHRIFQAGEMQENHSSDPSPLMQFYYWSWSGVLVIFAIADPNLVKSRTFHVNRTSAPAFKAQCAMSAS